MGRIPLDVINRLWPRGDSVIKGLRQAISQGDAWLEETGITSPLQVAHLMAQVSHECGAGTTMVENLNYRAEVLVRQWPTHFTPGQAAQMAHHPQLIANQAYNGRMGNRVGSDDGWNYRGRGGVQTTGREAYEKLGKKTGLDLVNHPELVIDPQHFMRVVCYDFVMCGCLPYASPSKDFPEGDFVRVTKRLNGGTIGLDSRRAWFKQWRSALKG